MSVVHHWAGVCDELSPKHAHIIMSICPNGDTEVWTVPLERFRVQPRMGDIVRVRVCPRRCRFTVFDRQDRRRC